MKKKMKKLVLKKETVRDLKLNAIQGGGVMETATCGFQCQLDATKDPRTVAIYD